jgi:hypothetical protein
MTGAVGGFQAHLACFETADHATMNDEVSFCHVALHVKNIGRTS